jgi:3-deoxy-D-manno-octulosonate 8-phosphate phosphatase (KDO 8-P phosphatase)
VPTTTSQEKLLQQIAGQVKLIVFDFDGVFTDNRVLALQDGSEGVFCSRADGLGLETVRNLGINLLVVSQERNPVVSARCKKLKLHCIQGCDNKSDVLKQEVDKLGISMNDVAYMGNDINDLECMRIVGLPACVSDSFPEVAKASLYQSKAKGGYGAVREFCDYISKAKIGKIMKKNKKTGYGYENKKRENKVKKYL